MTSHLLARASAVVLIATLLVGCSWRIDTATPDWPSPDPVTVARDQAAEREQAVIDAARNLGGNGTPPEVVLAALEETQAPERLEALGGLYEPYPHATPSPLEPAEPIRLEDAVADARDGALADALVTTDPDLALLLATIGLSHALSAWYAQWVEDAIGEATLPIVEERSLPSSVLAGPTSETATASLTPTTTDIEASVLADLALMHDQARYAYEVMAARANEDEREQWLERRDQQSTRAQTLVQLPGVEDLRTATYVVLAEDTLDSSQRLETARDIEMRAGLRYITLLASTDVDDWPWLLHAAFDAYAQAAALDGATASTYPIVALPGLTVE